VRKKKNLPTDRELSILRVLWREKEATVRQVLDALNRSGEKDSRELALTTVTTLLNHMVDKGLAAKSKTTGRFKYRALISKQEGSAKIIRDLARRLGRDARRMLMAGLLEDSDLEETDLQSLKELVDQKLNRIEKKESRE